jgi:hypothetical protein
VHMVVRGAASDDRAGGGEHLVNHPALASRGEDVVSRTERLLVTGIRSGDETIERHIDRVISTMPIRASW